MMSRSASVFSGAASKPLIMAPGTELLARPLPIAIGNGLASSSVPGAMMRGFEAAPEKTLADRLIMALEYGLEAGGEAYPLPSASIKIAHIGIPFPPVDLRVDFSEEPIAELRRLSELWEPMMEGYIKRCLDPKNSPAAASIEIG